MLSTPAAAASHHHLSSSNTPQLLRKRTIITLSPSAALHMLGINSRCRTLRDPPCQTLLSPVIIHPFEVERVKMAGQLSVIIVSKTVPPT